MSKPLSDKLLIEHLSKSFDGKTVLKDLNFSVKDGEFLSVLGSSGCGKTTLLRILIGLEKIDRGQAGQTCSSGRVLKDGIDITHLSPSARKMGIVFQNYALFDNMTVLENVRYALTKQKNLKAHAHDIAMQTLESVGLLEHINKRPRELSGGQQQRVAIARTLALAPDIILFDEPMSALDVDTRLALRVELKNLQKKYNSTMIYITHDQEEAFAMSDRIMVMRDGQIEQIADPLSMVNSPANEYIQQFVVDNINAKINSLMPFAKSIL